MMWKAFRNFNAVIGHKDLLVKSRRHMQLLMLIVCLKYLMSSRRGLKKKVECNQYNFLKYVVTILVHQLDYFLVAI